jgi:excisionase family DNA binding protein
MNDKPMIVTLNTDQLTAIIEQAVTTALNKAPPPRLMFTLQEAAQRLGVEENWLAERVRKGEIPHRRPGHRIHFSEEDLLVILEKWKATGKK